MTDPRYIRTVGMPLFAALAVVVMPVQGVAQGPSDRDLVAIEAGPVYTPFTVQPVVQNRSGIQATSMREYPANLRDSGGRRLPPTTVMVWFYISDTGQVLHSQIDQSSGYEELDQAALRIATAYQFTPAMNSRQVQNPVPLSHAVIRIREAPVAVWIILPIRFGLW